MVRTRREPFASEFSLMSEHDVVAFVTFQLVPTDNDRCMGPFLPPLVVSLSSFISFSTAE